MDRKEFVIYWARFVKKHSDREWSRQQKIYHNEKWIERYTLFFLV